ncbi:MAG: hypothetical protein E2590_07380 [Chryseobacterium sp.]|nr:hypothetical protein [Chryseobacterium sp.]
MKIKHIVIIFILFWSCKQNVSPTKIIKSNEPQKRGIRNNGFIDSLQYFSLTPVYFNEYYSGSKINIKNKELMENAIKNSKYFIPELTEKILDTAKTEITSSNEVYYYRVGDIATKLIDISRKENLQDFILEEFNENDLKNIQEMTRDYIGFEERVYLPLFYNQDGSVKIQNRNRLYQLYKRKINNK